MPTDTTRTWLRFDGSAELDRTDRLDGSAPACRLTLPRGFDVREGARDWVLGTASDDLGVDRVELYYVTGRRPIS